MSELKPCPFCGKPGRLSAGEQFVECSNGACDVHGLAIDVECWNRRALESPSAPVAEAAECHKSEGWFCPHCRPCRLAMKLDEAENVLRGLASYLTAGGFNDDKCGLEFDAKLFDEKIRWGIDYIISAETRRTSDPLYSLLRELVEHVEAHSHQLLDESRKGAEGTLSMRVHEALQAHERGRAAAPVGESRQVEGLVGKWRDLLEACANEFDFHKMTYEAAKVRAKLKQFAALQSQGIPEGQADKCSIEASAGQWYCTTHRCYFGDATDDTLENPCPIYISPEEKDEVTRRHMQLTYELLGRTDEDGDMPSPAVHKRIRESLGMSAEDK